MSEILYTVLLLPLVCAFLIKPQPITAFLSVGGVVIWIMMGMLASGIGC
jgi:hypothetical protein